CDRYSLRAAQTAKEISPALKMTVTATKAVASAARNSMTDWFKNLRPCRITPSAPPIVAKAARIRQTARNISETSLLPASSTEFQTAWQSSGLDTCDFLKVAASQQPGAKNRPAPIAESRAVDVPLVQRASNEAGSSEAFHIHGAPVEHYSFWF